MKKIAFVFMVLIALGLMVSSCSESEDGVPITTLTGVFIDDPVEGLHYECSSGSIGITNEKGEYTCKIGDKVTFSIGSVPIGTVSARTAITPYTLFPSDVEAAINLARLLQTIDLDASVDKIKISENHIIPADLNFSSESFVTDVALSLNDKVLVSRDKAIFLLNDNLAIKAGTEISYNGFNYNTIESPITNRIWLDRNLGATEACNSFNTLNCYGDYYQWGRGTDGHEKVDSNESLTYETDLNNTSNMFVSLTRDWITTDINGPKRALNWSKIDGTSICPTGFRVPTADEWRAEEIYGLEPIFNSLNLPAAGYRFTDEGIVYSGEKGSYWSSSSFVSAPGFDDFLSFAFNLENTYRSISADYREEGRSVRCIKDVKIIHNGVTYLSMKSPITQRVWLDRNLGASRACLSKTDTACYGDLYQWGRGTDGHEKRTSLRTLTMEANITNTSDKFYDGKSYPNYAYDWTRSDNDASLRVAMWSRIDGKSVCPVGFRVPTLAELKAETIDAKGDGEAYNKFLNLPVAGVRSSERLTPIIYADNMGMLGTTTITFSDYSSHIYGLTTWVLYFGGYSGEFAVDIGETPTEGVSLRCIKD